MSRNSRKSGWRVGSPPERLMVSSTPSTVFLHSGQRPRVYEWKTSRPSTLGVLMNLGSTSGSFNIALPQDRETAGTHGGRGLGRGRGHGRKWEGRARLGHPIEHGFV